MPDFHQKIDQLRDTLVGVVPQPEGQIAQITYALIYKFMNDFDAESVALGGGRRVRARRRRLRDDAHQGQRAEHDRRQRPKRAGRAETLDRFPTCGAETHRKFAVRFLPSRVALCHSCRFA